MTKYQIIEELISSKTIQDYVKTINLSDEELSMVILRDPVMKVDVIEKNLQDIKNQGFDILYRYFVDFLQWFSDFKNASDDFIYLLKTSSNTIPFKTYGDILNELPDFLTNQLTQGSTEVTIERIGFGDHYCKDYVSMIDINKITSTSFDPDYSDDLYAVNILKAFKLYDIVKDVIAGKMSIITDLTEYENSTYPDITTAYTMRIEGVNGCDNKIYYNHVNPQCYERVDEYSKDFLRYNGHELLHIIKDSISHNSSFYDIATIFNLYKLKI